MIVAASVVLASTSGDHRGGGSHGLPSGGVLHLDCQQDPHRLGVGSAEEVMPEDLDPHVVVFVFPMHDAVVDVGDLIRTGEAAQILGCSRQHVVDLCNEGKLPVKREGGSHRYIRRSDVLALARRPLT